MNISQLLEALKDPSVSISVSEKLLAGVSVAILSMSVVFVVLVIISMIINILQREKVKADNTKDIVVSEALPVEENNDSEDIEELISVITAAICQATGKSADSIRVSKIVRSNNLKSSWESMSSNITK